MQREVRQVLLEEEETECKWAGLIYRVEWSV